MKSMNKSGRVMHGWIKDDGGCPPSMKSIKRSRDKIDSFIKHLIGHQLLLSNNVKDIMVANGICFFSDFLSFLETEPSGKYQKNPGNHLFVRKVRMF